MVTLLDVNVHTSFFFVCLECNSMHLDLMFFPSVLFLYPYKFQLFSALLLLYVHLIRVLIYKSQIIEISKFRVANKLRLYQYKTTVLIDRR